MGIPLFTLPHMFIAWNQREFLWKLEQIPLCTTTTASMPFWLLPRTVSTRRWSSCMAMGKQRGGKSRKHLDWCIICIYV